MHAALEIAQQVVALLKAVTYWNPENVVRERVVGFARRDGELPAVSVFMAEDQPYPTTARRTWRSSTAN